MNRLNSKHAAPREQAGAPATYPRSAAHRSPAIIPRKRKAKIHWSTKYGR